MAEKPQTVKQQLIALEKLVNKVKRNAFKDNTLDYTIQIAISSLEPGVVKYGVMINGLKKEIQPIAVSYKSYEELDAVLNGLLENVNLQSLEEMFHKGRINVYKNAIESHEERLKHLAEHGLEEDDDIEMEKV